MIAEQAMFPMFARQSRMQITPPDVAHPLVQTSGAVNPAPAGGEKPAFSDPDGLRPYQREAVTLIDEALAANRSTLLVMATGLGKTVTFASIARHWPGRVLVLAHRKELLDQARRRLATLTGEWVGLEKAERSSGSERIVVASVQTLKERRLERFAKDPFGLVIVDEAHHATAKGYRKILAAFPGAKILGVTATPDRSDREQLGQIFDTVAYRKDVEEGIDEAWLTRYWMRPAIQVDVNLDKISTRGGDFADGELDEAIAQAIAPIATALMEQADGRRSLTFTPGVKTAHAAAEALNKLRPGCARAIDGSMDGGERDAILGGHRNGDFPHLLNCQVLTEGYDDPQLLVGMLAKPTKSRMVHAQQAGRLLRLWPGCEEIADADARRVAIAASPKPRAEFLDLACNSTKHELASPIDMLGGKITDQERKLAKKILRADGGDPRKALEAAREEIRAAGARAARSKTTVKFGETNDPFALFGVRNPERHLREVNPWLLATDKQVRWLKKDFGIDAPELCTKRQFRLLLGQARKREQQGLCSMRQIKWLQRFGIDGRQMPVATGRAIADAYRAGDKLMPGPQVIESIIARSREVGAEG